MTFTYSQAWSTWTANAFQRNGERLLKCHLKGKTCRKLNWKMDRLLLILKWPHGFICPFTSALAIYHNIQMFIGIYSISQVSVYSTIGPLVMHTCTTNHKDIRFSAFTKGQINKLENWIYYFILPSITKMTYLFHV